MKEKIKLGIISSLAVVGLAAAPALAVPETDNGSENPHNKVTICHATGSQSNPYVVNTPNANGDVSGHAGNSHQDGRDIIPPFEYNDGGETKMFPGQNWDAEHQAIYNNDCQAGGQGGGTTTTNTVNNQTTNVTQVASTQTAGRGQAPVAHAPQVAVPQGAVSAGAGGAASEYSTGAIAGLVASVGAMIGGALRLGLGKGLF